MKCKVCMFLISLLGLPLAAQDQDEQPANHNPRNGPQLRP